MKNITEIVENLTDYLMEEDNSLSDCVLEIIKSADNIRKYAEV